MCAAIQMSRLILLHRNLSQFTPDFAFVMGGIGNERFKRFEQLCAQAFNVLRKEADLFINLFALVSRFEAQEANSHLK
jgi:hypothetical protein